MQWALGDVADRWDELRKETEEAIDQFVMDHPDNFAVILGATALATSIEVGAGTVDLLRLGEGVAEGGVKGYSKDALRLVGVLPYVGGLGRLARRGRIGAKVLARSRAANQAARAARKAMRQTGRLPMVRRAMTSLRRPSRRAMLTVRDLLRRAGHARSRYDTPRLLHKLQEWKLVEPFNGPLPKKSTAFQQVLYTTDAAGNLGKILIQLPSSYHGAYVSLTGERYSADDAGQVKHVFRNRGIALVDGVPCVELQAIMTEPATAEQAIVARKRALRGNVRGWSRRTVRRGDWLSKIAGNAYGDMRKWPVVYQANRDVIGDNPNLIRPGQHLWIPDLKTLCSG